jgi:hypothetical protein
VAAVAVWDGHCFVLALVDQTIKPAPMRIGLRLRHILTFGVNVRGLYASFHSRDLLICSRMEEATGPSGNGSECVAGERVAIPEF